MTDLKEKLKLIVDRAFKGGTNKYIKINKNQAQWSKNTSTTTVTKEDIYEMIDYIIDNAYFKFGDTVYRQLIGLPMGIDPAPPMANLYLHYYEFRYMEQLTKHDYGAAKLYNLICRFIDDLIALNNKGHFAANIENIYPKELKLNKENKDDSTATYLDLDLKIEDKQIVTKTYDKRDAFSFEIVNYPDMSSNIPQNPAYGVISSQLIRYTKTCSGKDDFIDRLKVLIAKLKRKGYVTERIAKTIKKTMTRHAWIRKRHNVRIQEIM